MEGRRRVRRAARLGGWLMALWIGATLSLPARAGQWTSAAPMTSLRAYHSVTLLADGRVLAAGGTTTTAAHAADVTSEVFDPASGAWTSTPATPRFEHCTSLLADGRVLVAGGQDWVSSLVSAEIFDPASSTWSPVASMHDGRAWCTATLLPDGRVLVTGGLRGAGATAVADTEVYDPVSDTWSRSASMKEPRAQHTATPLPDGRVLVVGGVALYDASGALASAEIYDPSADAWSPAASLVEARGLHTATTLADGRILIAGGVSNEGSAVFFRASAEIYTPATAAWSVAASMHDPRATHVAFALGNGRVLAAGGGQAGGLVPTVELYDPVADTWATDAPMHYDTRAYFAGAVLADGRVLVTGGMPENYATPARAEAELYTPDTGAACALPSDCPSGFCAQGTCCDAPCEGTCGVCSRAHGAPFDGTCTYLPQRADGVCERSCTSVHDCVPPAVCDADGRCVAAPPAVSDASGCHLPARAPDGSPRVIAAAVALAAAVARRRGGRGSLRKTGAIR